jgi:hypothetical protein
VILAKVTTQPKTAKNFNKLGIFTPKNSEKQVTNSEKQLEKLLSLKIRWSEPPESASWPPHPA